MVENNLRLFLAITLSWIHGRPIHRVAARWIAAVRPVDRLVGKVEFKVNRFWQALVEKFDVFAIGGALVLWNLKIGAKDTSIAGIVRALLSPIKFAGFDVEHDTYAPFLNVFTRTWVAFAGIDKCFDVGTIHVRAHDPHPFTIAPVQLPVLLIELQLLGSESVARTDNVGNVASVKIRALDGTVIGVGVAHVGPIEVTSPGVHDDAVWKSPSLAHNYLEVGAVGVRGKHLTTARTEKEQAGRRGLCCGFLDFPFRRLNSHDFFRSFITSVLADRLDKKPQFSS